MWAECLNNPHRLEGPQHAAQAQRLLHPFPLRAQVRVTWLHKRCPIGGPTLPSEGKNEKWLLKPCYHEGQNIAGPEQPVWRQNHKRLLSACVLGGLNVVRTATCALTSRGSLTFSVRTKSQVAIGPLPSLAAEGRLDGYISLAILGLSNDNLPPSTLWAPTRVKWRHHTPHAVSGIPNT